MSKAFVVITQSNWLIEELRVGVRSAGGFDFYTSYGWDLPRKILDYDEVSWWMPGEYGARVQKIGLAPYLTSPDPGWLTEQDTRFTGRTTVLSTVADVLSNPPEGTVFIKPANVKIDTAPAQVLEGEDLVNTLQSWEPDTWVLYTDRICDFSDEYRFYVVDDDIMTGSVYMQDGSTFYDGAQDDRYAEAFLFASQFLVYGDKKKHPESFVLDVGFDRLKDEWLVIEANPTWSSGFYGCKIEEVVHAIHRSCNPSDRCTDLWVPDPHILSKVSRKVDIALS